ncbi:hypothetical protein JVU11DRAFT_5597 [Chiua virens]|nr:hypothetical protein JVU11DRAFT_11912 [Chiua virens]KAG9313293.1 hypothetical protein JVU11DRAFT_5597 [Chiua virens]
MNSMDPVVHHNQSQSTLSPVSSSRRRSSRENETPAQKQKREKAAERQRRKRERDRHVNNLNAAMSYPQPTEPLPPPQPQPPQPPPQIFTGQELSQEELGRRERVRAAARERQRKHRSLVKQRKMRDLGLDMTSEMMVGIEEQLRVNGQHEYPLLPHEMGPPPPMNPQDPSAFLPPQMPSRGHSFAWTLMISLGYAPQQIKQYLHRGLGLSAEDLAVLESMITDAFNQWDAQRMHFGQPPKAPDGSMPAPSAPPFPDMSDPAANGFGEQPQPPDAHVFRARFRGPISAPVPIPFRNLNPADSTTATSPTSTPGSGPPSDPIDPHLGLVIATGDERQKVTADTDTEGGEVEQS